MSDITDVSCWQPVITLPNPVMLMSGFKIRLQVRVHINIRKITLPMWFLRRRYQKAITKNTITSDKRPKVIISSA